MFYSEETTPKYNKITTPKEIFEFIKKEKINIKLNNKLSDLTNEEIESLYPVSGDILLTSFNWDKIDNTIHLEGIHSISIVLALIKYSMIQNSSIEVYDIIGKTLLKEQQKLLLKQPEKTLKTISIFSNQYYNLTYKEFKQKINENKIQTTTGFKKLSNNLEDIKENLKNSCLMEENIYIVLEVIQKNMLE